MEYQYPILNENWDIHWLRMRIYYETDLLPDWASLFSPNAFIGFNNPLSEVDKAKLDLAMANPKIGLEPINIKHRFTALIDPIKLNTVIKNAIGKKVLYHCIEGNVDLIFLENLTNTDITNLKKLLRDMWI